ncbi:MAG TPA: YqcI/YcgG family protein [Henriciella marina]|uniref:guanitoxin biosynthesis heme-dependent pre-guanitoxin N-hydroxylase GntA n=1 Tax=Henriciella sp. TaxID=1968823 RepID=UPI00185E96A4|nr:guanitoxin biosynthesis heme-dependent pre-guanitoxin N-hydroxylase GntA [Henriciella sp.]HIG24162.1 YqcI/YcgG family protein [Henriciella sp.]HIK63510.1 YqcI/YcgG family protein [Henriciella marina]
MTDGKNPIVSRFEDFISSDDFPCIGAKSALVREGLETRCYRSILRTSDDFELQRELTSFLRNIDVNSPIVRSFAAIFPDEAPSTEPEFERALWDRLQSLHNLDVASGGAWATNVSGDPQSSHFSMSLAGHAFFVVGLHPAASRPARRFEYPVLVFNSHDQFERLREDKRYAKMQEVIRQRDEALSGSINPMLADHGFGAAAAQYSGREVDSDWVCPFEKKELVT